MCRFFAGRAWRIGNTFEGNRAGMDLLGECLRDQQREYIGRQYGSKFGMTLSANAWRGGDKFAEKLVARILNRVDQYKRNMQLFCMPGS